MIADILPAGVIAAESFGPLRARKLFPAEAAAVATANPGRRLEFAAARSVAHAALAGLGAPVVPVLPGWAGEPRWPQGVVGSITHCAGYRACAVALARDLAAIGIDAEPCLPVAGGPLAAQAGDAERAGLAGLRAAGPGTPWDRVLFSAKESVWKAWYTHTGRRPPLRTITIRISMAGMFAATLPCGCAPPAPGPPRASAGGPPVARLSGRWRVRSGLILTAVSVPGLAGPATPVPARDVPP
jgi:4'-phosphopantetheinyl transferase EntD